MPSVTVDVQLHVWYPEIQHRHVVLNRPDGVDTIARAGRGDEGRRHVARNLGGHAIARKRRRPRVDDAGKVRPGMSALHRILCVEVFVENRGGRGQFGARGKTHDADLVRIDIPFLGRGAHHTDRL